MKKVLFICLGNICRSPTAEGIFKNLVEKEELSSKIQCDSAGTSAYHEGSSADLRSTQHALERGYTLCGKSRLFQNPDDFINFDMLITMDNKNYETVVSLDKEGKYKNKIFKATSFCKIHNLKEVPDPYTKGSSGFELVLDILEDSCKELLKGLKNDL